MASLNLLIASSRSAIIDGVSSGIGREGKGFLSLVGPREWKELPGKFVCSALYRTDKTFYIVEANDKLFLSELQNHLKKIKQG